MGSFLSFWKAPAESEQNMIVMPFKNKQIEAIAKKFLLSPSDMIFFHQVFRNMDKLGNGYISEDNVFEFVQEEKTSVLSPYITKLFQLIEKENADRVCFVEWVPAISAFCLFTHEQIIKFVFGMIDDDHDEVISKKDIIKFLVKERYGEKVFPFNQVRAIELLDVDRADRIKFEQFKRIEQQIPFLCYPAFRLQEIFKEQIKGNAFWKKTFQSIFQQEQEREKQKQQEIIDEQVNKKKNIEFSKRELNFEQLTHNKKIEQNIFKNNYLQNNKEALINRTYILNRNVYDISNTNNRNDENDNNNVYNSTMKRIALQHSNQECIQIDYKVAVNHRRFSDGIIDTVFLPPKSSFKQANNANITNRDETNQYSGSDPKMEQLMPQLETTNLRKSNSQIYIKQPFSSTSTASEKAEDGMQNSKIESPPPLSSSHRNNKYQHNVFPFNSPSNRQDFMVNTPKNYNTPKNGYNNNFNDNYNQTQKSTKKRKIIPRSLKNTASVEPTQSKQNQNQNQTPQNYTPRP